MSRCRRHSWLQVHLFLYAVVFLVTEVMSLCSVLEAGRTLTLAEKGGAGAEEITAAPGFRLVATMNPGLPLCLLTLSLVL